jgi:ATP-dependent RNA helicase DeaD
MGFAEDLEAILDEVPSERQTALFSATIPRRIAALAERHLHEPERITIQRERLAKGEVPRVRQLVYMVNRRDKIPALGRVMDMENPTSAMVFCRTRTEVDELAEKLAAHGYRAEALHGGMSQDQRARVMKRFREGAYELLIATDVAARGLDIEHVSHVVNFDVPSAPDAYVHRIGRTGRAGREGTAITFAEPRERRLLSNIEQLTGQKMKVETVPTVRDLRARRMELTSASIRQALEAGNLEKYAVIVESLSNDFDLMDIAAAAVKLVHEATREPNEAEIAPVVSKPEREAGRERGHRPAGQQPYEKARQRSYDKPQERPREKLRERPYEKRSDAKKESYQGKREARRDRSRRPR